MIVQESNRKLLYLTIICLYISLAVGKLSLFMEKPAQTHLDSTMMVLQYIKSSP